MSRRLALIVANDSYRDEGLAALYAPVYEARQLGELLRDPEIGGFDLVDILPNESKPEIERQMERMFASAEPGDLITLYFSGHGVRSRNGELHLAVSNTDLSLLASTSVAASFVRNRIDESDASSTVLLLDCCYSGAFTDGRGTLKADPQINVGNELSAGRGIYVLTAASSVQTATDGQPETVATPRTLSAFTEAVVRGLSTGAADVRGMGRITPNDLWEYVRQEVPSRTTRQTPTQYGYVEDEVHLANVRRTFPTAAVNAGGTRVHLGDLLGTLTQTADKGLRAEEWQGTGRLVVPIGQVLRNNERAEPVWLDLAHNDGHVLVVGRIGSGKSTLLRTLVGALAVTHSPDEARLYFLESGGNKLGSLRRLPAFARMAGDEDADEVERLLDDIHRVIDQRKRLFRDYDIDSASMFRALRSGLPGGSHPDLFLLVDRWPEFAEHAQRILRVASGGLEYGVHLVVTARSWREVPDELEELVHCRIELGLSQPADSHIDPQLAGQLPPDRPGWALLRRSRFLIALPELRTAIGAPADVWANETADGALELVDRVTQAWSRTLPYPPPPMSPAPLYPPPPSPPPPPPPPPPFGSPAGAPSYGSQPAGSAAPAGPPASRSVPATPPVAPSPPVPASDEDTTEAPDWLDQPVEPPVQRTPGRPLGEPSPNILDLLGINSYAPLPPPGRRARRDRLLVPIGIDSHGNRVELDIKEAAAGGMGPHGLIVGATGSGKSELLRTLITALASTHDAQTLTLLLADFKGDTTFAPFRGLPQVAGLVTDLADDPSLVGRLSDVLLGELTHRQELLRQAGNFASQSDYETARDGGADLEPLPSLLLVLDEFSELLTARPDFIDTLIAIGRTGRSTGVHMLLASQRLEEGKLRGLDSHLSYRIGLRTFSAMESRTVLGIPDAYELPRAPGGGYLRAGTEPPQRFLAASSFRPMPDSGGETLTAAEAVTQAQRSLPPVRPIWLPPLERSPLLDELLGPVAVETGRGLSGQIPHQDGSKVPIGRLDKPFERVQEPLVLPVGERTNTIVVGGPRSGKSTFLQTFVCALALTHPPTEVHVYGLDLDAGALGELRELPHVGGVADRRDPALVRRTVADVAATLAQREATLAPADGWPHVFLVIDGWSTFRQEFDDLEVTINDLAAQGPENGIYLVLTAQRSIHLRAALRDHFWARFELRLSDPSDSDLNRRIAMTVPLDQPGRGITRDGNHFLIALPHIAGEDGLRGLVRAIAAAWSGPGAPAVRQLPQLLPYAELDLDTEPGQALTLPIGIAETDLDQVGVDFARDPHLLIVGDPGSGKSALLRSLAATIAHRFGPEQATVTVIDSRRAQAGPAARASRIDALVPILQSRLPASDVTPQQLRERSWWSGPELFVLVDDYNLLLASGSTSPLQPLVQYLPQARDVGLHLVLARSASGISRALYEPVIRTLQELVSPTLIMSGSPDEGIVAGRVKPGSLPPGRGWLVTRREGTRLVQLAYLPDSDDDLVG
jgi:type VII secretion protein EccCb